MSILALSREKLTDNSWRPKKIETAVLMPLNDDVVGTPGILEMRDG